MTSTEIRKAFMDFFITKGHTIVPSAPIVIKDDPTLMFTNAGMNQFKDFFLGNKKAPYSRVADTQKCLRVSGKHNDLEEVGVDTYHHTMFEMLGNWSFGDYFKKEAIEWSWELLAKIYKIPTDKIYVTVFGGDEKEKLPKDDEAITEWKKWIAEDRILLFGRKDNFWEMGDIGPCGPCTEIHVDCRPDEERKKTDGKTLVNNDHPQVIEIWNNVFIQYNRLKDGSLEPLPAKHVDTGMGLERLVRVLQGKQSNYDTDIFTGTIAQIEKITGKKYDNSDSKEAIAFRVIADHIRAIAFTIADGQLPSNTGAGYVIRRILRRAVRYYYSYLDYKKPLLHKLLPGLSKEFERVFPELQKQIDFVSRVIKEEEDTFLRTIDKGLQKLNGYIEIMKSTHPGVEKISIDGKLAFELFDTFGFPLDLTQLIAKENRHIVDVDGFNFFMKEQKTRSRAATSIDTEDWIMVKDKALTFEISTLTDEGKENVQEVNRTSVNQYRKIKIKESEFYQIVLESSNFYAEGGGQVGDTGVLIFDEKEVIEVIDTKSESGLKIHITKRIPQEININTIVQPIVDIKRKRNIALHHSATHLVHAALRKILGTHVTQKGSLVNDVHLRFDFSHFAKVTDEEISKVEALVNEKIRANIPVVIKQMPKVEALKLGAMALFGEKYGDVVRVVIIDPNYSVELCGGTHVGTTGELGFFKIINETAVAAGVRRIEAVSGKAAEDYINNEFELIRVIGESLKNPKDLKRSVENLLAENTELNKRIEHLEARQLVAIRNELLHKDEIINGITFIGEIIETSNPDALKKLCFELKNKLNDHLAVLCCNIDGKAFVAVGISEKVVVAKKLDAGKIIKEIVAPLIKGGGGGQKTLATAGGQDVSNLRQVIEEVKRIL